VKLWKKPALHGNSSFFECSSSVTKLLYAGELDEEWREEKWERLWAVAKAGPCLCLAVDGRVAKTKREIDE
jgi:hypothetical protein